MTVLPYILSLWSILYSLIYAAETSFTISVKREVGDPKSIIALSQIRKRSSGTVPVELGKSLYWFGNFSVGDSSSLRLLIDTGSSDLLINPGLYKPSKHAKPYTAKTFTITYEGVNRAGFGFETLNGTIKKDIVTGAGLTLPDHPIGNITSYKYEDTPQLNRAIQGQGIIGFLGKGSSSFRPRAPSWFFSLCKHEVISHCKFGLAFGTSGTGLTIVGKLAKKLFKDDLIITPRITHPYEAWTVRADVFLDGKEVAKNQTIIMDSGTDNIQGPIPVVQTIFKQLGYQTHEKSSSMNPFDPGTKIKVLTADFPCGSPPKLGFSFPYQGGLKKARRSVSSKKSKIFEVSPKVWNVYNHGNNNCTSILGGTNALNDPESHTSAWLLGQPFFAGHYVDFDIAGRIGFADLKNPETVTL